ncbi:MAG: hypothetical protein IPP04_06820 [Saprospiraceae bacterium]|nr:hypothetical protein [Saprospiraceae bacterium]
MSSSSFCSLALVLICSLVKAKAQDFVFPIDDNLKDIEGITRIITESKFDSSVYIGGKFTNINGCPSSTTRILKIKNNLTTPFAQFLGGAGAIVYDIIEANSRIYLAGNFTGTIDSIKFQNIAMWDGKKWSNMGGGLNNDVFDLKYNSQNGRIYAGGRFSDAGGDKDADLIAYWEGSSWKKVEGDKQIGNVGVVYAMEISSNGNLFVGGSISVFDSLRKYVANAIIVWDGKSWKGLVEECENILSGGLTRSIIEINGRLYVTGNFQWGCGEKRHRQNVIYYDGKNFNDVGDKIELQYVNVLTERKGTLYVGGEFQKVNGSNKIQYVAKLNGNVWEQVIDTFGGNIYSLASVNGNLLIGGQFYNLNEIDELNAIAAYGYPELPTVSTYLIAPSSRYIDSLLLYSQKNRLDYHHYEISTELCSQSNPKCKLDRIWEIWKQKLSNQAPIRADFAKFSDRALTNGFKNRVLNKPAHELNITNNGTYTLNNTIDRIIMATFLKLQSLGTNTCLSASNLNIYEDNIIISVDEKEMCITNYTLPGHFLYPGRVKRCLKVKDCDKIYIETTGEGFNYCGDTFEGGLLSVLNLLLGKDAFKSVDARFKNEVLK